LIGRRFGLIPETAIFFEEFLMKKSGKAAEMRQTKMKLRIKMKVRTKDFF